MNMRGALIAGLMIAPCLLAQSVIDPARLPSALHELGPQPGEQLLRCEITPMRPGLDFSFRFQTGYSVGVPMQQYFGPGHVWAIITRVTPENGTPVWLAARVRLPEVPLTTVVTDTFGGFLVGPGRYKVDWAMFDDEGRVCRKQWKIEAKLSFGERHVQVAIPPHTVADFGGAGLPAKPPKPSDAPPFRLTVLLHAAPLSPRRLHLRNQRPHSARFNALRSARTGAGHHRAPGRVQPRTNSACSIAATISSCSPWVRLNQALNRLELETIDCGDFTAPAWDTSICSNP